MTYPYTNSLILGVHYLRRSYGREAEVRKLLELGKLIDRAEGRNQKELNELSGRLRTPFVIPDSANSKG